MTLLNFRQLKKINFWLLLLVFSLGIIFLTIKILPLSGSLRETPYQSVGSLNTEVINAEKVWWAKALIQKDPHLVYEEFRNIYADTIYADGHILAHIFGEALYTSLGLEGIKICDWAYTSGCFHSFYSEAIADQGVNVTKILDDECLGILGKKYLSCQHGIGHGLVYEFGYELENLIGTLKICESLNFPHQLFGCESGAFMEFNQRTMSEAGMRLVSDKDIFYPCNDVPEVYRDNCYYEFSQWHLNINGNNYTDTAAKCSSLNNVLNKQACFYGLIMISGAFLIEDADTVARMCLEFSDHIDDQTCVNFFSVGLRSRLDTQELRTSVCQRHTLPEEKDYCMSLTVDQLSFDYSR